jgi:hypothetical protein
LQEDEFQGGLNQLISNLLQQAYDAGQEEVLIAGIDRVVVEHRRSAQAWQLEVMADFLDGTEFQFDSFDELLRATSPRMKASLENLCELLETAREVVGDEEQQEPMRIHAARLLGRQRNRVPEDMVQLVRLLTPQVAASLQNAAIEAISRCDYPTLPELVLRDWSQMSPAVRTRVLDLLVSRKDWTRQLLDRIASGQLAAAEIGAVHRGRMLLHPSSDVRRQASDVLQPEQPMSRREVIDRYLAVVDQSRDVHRGRELFLQHCSNCHTLEGNGVNVGPDLLTLTDYSTESLMVAVLDPNQAQNPRFL